MDNQAFYKLTYGVFLLTTKHYSAMNGCITNTCIQVANNPTRIAVALMNSNYTCEILKRSGIFALSVLDETCPFEVFKHWGLQSGRDVNKLQGQMLPRNHKGMPYLDEHACAMFTATVVDQMDLGTHTLFIAEVLDAEKLSDKQPLTYTDYQTRVKPQRTAPVKEPKIIGWRCIICGYEYEEADLPADFICPICGHDTSDFESIYET